MRNTGGGGGKEGGGRESQYCQPVTWSTFVYCLHWSFLFGQHRNRKCGLPNAGDVYR